MRVSLVRNVGLHITALAVLALAACNDNPLDFDVKDTVGINANPSSMVVAAGRTALIESRAVNQGNEPTFADVSAAVDPSCGPGAITVEVDPEWLPEIQPPGRFIVTAGATLGPSCINLSSGSSTVQIDVVVVTNGIEITSPVPDQVFRAGDTGQIVAQLIDLDGNVVGPYAPEDAAFESSDPAVATIDDELGNFTTSTSGTTNLSVTWSGQEANGTSGLGVTRSDQVTIEVIATVPDTAFFAAGDDLGVLPVDVVEDFDVFVADELGNRNTIPDEIISVTAQSSDVNVATVTSRIDTDNAAFGQGDIPVVEVTTLAAGSVVISGTVETSSGSLPFSGTLLVPNPIINALNPASGSWAETITISGSDFVPGLTDVFVKRVDSGESYLLGNFTVDSDTQITAQMPTWSLPGEFEVTASVGGIVSPALVWTQTVGFDEPSTEPANDNPDAAPGCFTLDPAQCPTPQISIPAVIQGQLGLNEVPIFGTAGSDFFNFLLSTDTRDLDMTLAWDSDADLDIEAIDYSFFFLIDDGDGATLGNPENASIPAENWPLVDHPPGAVASGQVWLLDFGPGVSNYTMTLELEQ